MSSIKKKSFQPEIEGLRALAIIPIVLFHLNPEFCPGGFIGVDIFFVISGYLITRMILAEGNQFNFKKFYIRRFFRLFPALQATLLISLFLGWFIFSPSDYLQLAKSSLAAALGASNIYFFFTLDYFNNSNIYFPLLHTWSLGVEEQFYLFWPAIIVLTLYLRLSWVPIVIVLGISSFLLNTQFQSANGDLAFYMMPFRIFEFAIGATTLLLEKKWKKFHLSHVNNLLGLLGAALLTYAAIFFTEETAWPSSYTLIPTIGTMFLILAGASGHWYTILSFHAFRFIGRISYSLYLVHWPIIVFYSYYFVIKPTSFDLALLATCMLIAGTALYYFVEQPFKDGGKIPFFSKVTPQFQWKQTVIDFWETIQKPLVIIFGLFFMLTSSTIIWSNGFPSRLKERQVQHLDKGLSFAGDICHTPRKVCQFGSREAKKIVYVIGDSHALNLVHGLDKFFKQQNIKGLGFFDHGCYFAVGTARFIKGRVDTHCAKNIQTAFNELKKNNHPVIFAANYGGYHNKIGYKDNNSPLQHDRKQYFSWLEDRTKASLEFIHAEQRKVILFKQTYSTGINLAKCLFTPNTQTSKTQKEKCQALTRSQVMKKYKNADQLVENINTAFPKTHLIDPKALFCRQENCQVKNGTDLFLRDSDHLTNSGSTFLIQQASTELSNYLKTP